MRNTPRPDRSPAPTGSGATGSSIGDTHRRWWWLPGLVGVLALLAAGAALLRDGDLLAVPAVSLVILTWVVVALLTLTSWMLRVALPPAAAVARRLTAAAAIGLDTDPVGRRVTGVARRIRGVGASAVATRPGSWLADRLRPVPRGLGLTLCVAVILGCAAALFAIETRIDYPESSLSLVDLRFVDLAAAVNVPAQRMAMAVVTVLGDPETVVGILAALLLVTLLARIGYAGILLIAVPMVATGLTTVLKLLDQRARPAVGQLVETSASWPSGHATGGLAVALGVCLLCWAARVRHRAVVAALVVPIGLLVGYSRAYLTVHWLSDVVSGWIVAVLAAAVVTAVAFARGHRAPPGRRAVTGGDARRLLATGGVVVAVGALAVAVAGRSTRFPERPAQETTAVSADLGAVAAERADELSRTLLGQPVAPVSFVVAADSAALTGAFEAAGLSAATPLGVGGFAGAVTDALGGATGPGPPSPTFLSTEIQDLTYLPGSGPDPLDATVHLWRLPVRLSGGCPVWAGTAVRDVGTTWSLPSLLPQPTIDPVVDAARDAVVAGLTAPAADGTVALERTGAVEVMSPTLITGAAGGELFTDGRVTLLRGEGCVGP